ncbi:MAG TPA: hypothetical protein EYQ43_01955 [Methyloprofundus sp.]|uniref:hypothetical protein n=1 Tax=Methyloprofundus sp. TaxID=2020875 RepID=UPI001831C1B7|nr:hypothetical protein [Methyloprofundus sp.]HIG64342.1 hypothetical protein [Methyloprofundus sp.]HIL78762.1 hypothetical protein [Methylococcales bacterium]
MDLLKKLVMAFFVSFAMLAVAPSAMAAGKTENQTQAEVAQSLTDTVTVAEETLAAMKGGADKETVMALIKKTKQTAKTIESSVVLARRDRALAKVSKARGAYKKGQQEKAEDLMEKAVKGFKDVKAMYHNF